MKTLESIWIGIAIALTNATQARLTGLPIGVGEVMILMWLIFLLRRILISKYHFMTSIVRINFWFWLFAFTSLSLGLLIAEFTGLKASGVERDFLAFFLMLLISIGLSLSKHFYAETEKIILYFLSFSLSFLFIVFLFPLKLPITLWYGGVRFTGWAENPNQLALLLSLVPFLILHLLSQENNILRIWYLLLITICFVLGIATGSDALLVAWIAGFGTLIYLAILKLFIYLFNRNLKTFKKNIYQKISGIFFVTTSLIIINIIYLVNASSSANLYDKDPQASERVILWKHGIAAILHSPLFGLGPGAHSGEVGPFLNFEAHNTFIDWGASTGIIGLIAYISLLTWIAWNAWQQKYIFLFVAVISLAGFSTFHYVLRHPVFWFYLQVIMTLSQKSSKTFHPILMTSFNPHL
ncbi:hypothetical protein F7734_08340 [Scytonema sp. UIC 10036]|uniref:O-antigen ligase family protein n=1 Tax=Scytonema sp. UIC 10036 TaxID=2304196 RepID=UPI0012DA965E|nr:O-antigen ligase family protein [Scytonema sp. UIC 10036]MUG92465.1 hypothetical protein [Scytonema sp. UIC 10036]